MSHLDILRYKKRERKNLIQPQETYTGSKVTYCLLCHYEQKHVFAKGKDDCIIIIVTIQLKIEEKADSEMHNH